MNYFNKMMVDAFGIITKRKVPWPDDMTFEQKVSLHEKEINKLENLKKACFEKMTSASSKHFEYNN